MQPRPEYTRREVLRAAAWGSVAAALAACGGRQPSRSAGSTQALASPTGQTPSPAATASVAPSASPESLPSLAQRVARMLVVGFRGRSLDDGDWISSAIAEAGLGGVVLFDRDGKSGGARNVSSPDQLRRLVADLKARAGGRDLIIAIDQEGGRVARLTPRWGFPEVVSQAEIGATGDPTKVARWAEGLAGTLADVGITCNLAPVVDLDINPRNPAVGALDRSFSADPDVVGDCARIEIAAHRAAGVRTTLKHFPGLGSATVNTDFGVADVTDTWSPTELEPYRSLIESGDAESVMVGHVMNGQLDANLPASLSVATVAGVLRGELGWDGVVVTDDLQAAAITERFGRDEAIALALEAGCDLLLFANQQVHDRDIVPRVVDTVLDLVDQGRIDEARINESYARIADFAAVR